MTTHLFCLILLMSCQTWSRTIASRPVVGSSRITIELSDGEISARAILSRLLRPPLRFWVSTCLWESRDTVRMSCSTFWVIWLAVRPPPKRCDLSWWKRYMCYSTVSVSKRTSCWEHTPISAWAACVFSVISITSLEILTCTVPWLGVSFPIRQFNEVVFPAPLWPKKQNISFLNRFKFMLLTAVKEPNDFVIFRNWTAGVS